MADKSGDSPSRTDCSDRRSRPRSRDTKAGKRRSRSRSGSPSCRGSGNGRRRSGSGGSSDRKYDRKAAGVVELDKPIQSPLDQKQYRVIQLKNGLKAVLISDLNARKNGKVLQNVNCIDARVIKFNEEVLGIQRKCDNCTLTGSYNLEDIDNPEGYIWVKDDDTTAKETGDLLAAASLTVGVGSYHPQDYLGLAHFCEHMIFFGSKTYPEHGLLDRLVSENGGEFGGTTFGDHTTYSFSIYNKKFEEALDIFGHLFIDPLVPLEKIINERDTVDSEFQNKLVSESYRRAQILRNSGKEDHPATRFRPGNNTTLGDSKRIDASVRKLHKSVVDFLSSNYKAEIMTLAVQAPLKLDYLEKVVVEIFGAIPSGAPDTILKFNRAHGQLPFDTPEFRRFYKVVPVNDVHQLWVTWELPAAAALNYQVQPLLYLGRLLQSESPGGLLQHLKRWNWIHNLIDARFLDVTPFSATFHIGFQLTDSGFRVCGSILEALFAYLKHIAEKGIQQWYFTELQELRAMNFHFEESVAPREYTESLSQELAQVPPKDVLIASAFPTKWEPDTIRSYLAMLTPDAANYMIVSKALASECTETELWLKAPYKVEDMKPDKLERFRTPLIDGDCPFRAPQPSEFITTSFCQVKSGEGDVLNNFRIIYQDNRTRVEHEMMYNFGGKSDITVKFLSPMKNFCGQNVIMTKMWIRLLRSKLQGVLQAALEAGLTCEIGSTHLAVTILLSGYSERLPGLLSMVLSEMRKLEDELTRDAFDTTKRYYMDEFYNVCINLSELSGDIMRSVVLSKTWLRYELRLQLKFTEYEQFQKFCKDYMARMYVITTISGNFNLAMALNIGHEVLAKLNFEPLLMRTTPKIHVNQLPRGETIVRVRKMKEDNDDIVVTNYFELGMWNLKMDFFGKFLQGAMTEPLHEKFRIEEGVGYYIDVGFTVLETRVMLLWIKVTASAQKYRATTIYHKINAFVKYFNESHLRKITKAQFDDFMKKRMKVQNVDSRLNLTLMEARTLYEKYIYHSSAASEMRQFSVQIVGQSDTDYSVEHEEYGKYFGNHSRAVGLNRMKSKKKALECDFPLMVLVPPPAPSPLRSPVARYVDSIYEFKRSLETYPDQDD